MVCTPDPILVYHHLYSDPPMDEAFYGNLTHFERHFLEQQLEGIFRSVV